MPFKLISTDGDQSYELRDGIPLVVGRALNSDVPVFDPTISRRHAELYCEEGGVRIRDLGSSNGTFLNGSRVDTARGSSGDVLTFGKVAFRLKELAPTPTPLPESSRPAPVRARGPSIVKEFRISDAHGIGILEAVRAPEGDGQADPVAVAAAHERNEKRLEQLLEISKALARAVDVDELLDKIVRTVFQLMDVDRTAIMLTDEHGDLLPKISRDKRGGETGRAVPQSIARRVVQEKMAIISDNAPEDQRFGGQSILMQSVRSAMCAPMMGSDGAVRGVLYVDNLTATQRFKEDDLGFLVAFSGIAGVAIENSQFAERIRRETIVRSNFERYFAPNLAARIASSPDAVRLGGERLPVAILFSDIRGFTPLSETMRPDDLATLLSEYFTEMVEVVFRHGGTLDKFMGDAVMAQWGAPLGTPEDADHAMRAALDMLRELARLNVRWRAEGRPELQVGIGLNFGDVFAGNIGSERRLEFTVLGDAVNIASRLCSAAGGGEILLTDEMLRALKHPPPMRERAPMELRGKRQLVPVYSVVL